MATSLLAISVDGSDIGRLAQFWADVLDRPVSPGATVSFAAIDTASGLRFTFHQVPEGKTVKNRYSSIRKSHDHGVAAPCRPWRE